MEKLKHTDEERVWTGDADRHREEVWDVMFIHGHHQRPWDDFEILCDQPMCLQAAHIRVFSPKRLEYPARICVYCGRPAGTRDHLIPNTRSGHSDRRYVLTVPACAQCNSILGDRGVASIDSRRRYVQQRLAHKNWKVLGYEKLTAEELEEYGPMLRSVLEGASEEREHLEARLMWPDDPHYDIRYLQKSGYEHPLRTGLLELAPAEAEKDRRDRLTDYANEANRKRKRNAK